MTCTHLREQRKILLNERVINVVGEQLRSIGSARPNLIPAARTGFPGDEVPEASVCRARTSVCSYGLTFIRRSEISENISPGNGTMTTGPNRVIVCGKERERFKCCPCPTRTAFQYFKGIRSRRERAGAA